MQRLLRQGKSYSGRERNCAFLNLSGSADPSANRFATVSSATGLDFPDDARGLATCDWDHDGRVDFWITNRTAPRVRLMLNRYDTGGNSSVSLRLHGDGKSVNRDAIGARVEVYLPGSSVPLLRTVAAGSGFLSQSSLWQLIGLGRETEIAKVIVKWPGAAPESFTGVAPGGHFDLTQGSGRAVPWNPPDRPGSFAKAAAGQSPADDASEAARVVLLAPLPVPEQFLPAAPGKAGLLLNLWSRDCPNCLAELKDWGPQLKAWKSAGVNVASWCVDAGGADARRIASSRGFAAPVLTTASSGGKGPPGELMAILNALQKGCTGLQRDMPVPVSLLFDARRRLVAIYKGPASAKRIRADFSLLNASDEERRTAACPDQTGRWHDPLLAVGVKSAVASLLDAGLKSAAEQLLLAGAAHYEEGAGKSPSREAWRQMELNAIYNLLGAWEMERSDFPAAERRYLAALEAAATTETRRNLVKLYTAAGNPGWYPELAKQLEIIVAENQDPADLGMLGVLKLELGEPAAAVPLLRKSTGALPDPVNLFQLGQALRATGDAAQAAEAWTKALERKPDLVPALHNLAWLKATCSDAALRDGAAAVRLAARAVEITGGRRHVILAALAAAHAEAGDFKSAAECAARAEEAARAAGDAVWPDRLQRWLTGFQHRMPVREN